jgi:hypothetical protein
MNEPNAALAVVLDEVKKAGPKSDFAKKAFLEILQLLPVAPNIPGLEVFCEWGKKGVPFFIDWVIINDTGQVFLSYRDDPHFKGWHFPGFFRTPGKDQLLDCQEKAAKELGADFKIKRIKQSYLADRIDCPRFHHATLMALVEFEGKPSKGEWFSEMPEDIIPLHQPDWQKISGWRNIHP